MPKTKRWSRRGVLIGAASAGLLPLRSLGDIPRMKGIRERIEPSLVKQFAAAGLAYPARRVLLRVFKHERELELWVADDAEGQLSRLQTFPICAASGTLGPKLRWADDQVPEGVYQIHRYNAWSGFHMSLRVNYPNASDLARGNRHNPGGAIMVHGGCASIGCMAIENEAIERVFITTLDGGRAGRTKPTIMILPTRFDEPGWARLECFADAHGSHLTTLWTELAAIDSAFLASKRIPNIEIDGATGVYALRS